MLGAILDEEDPVNTPHAVYRTIGRIAMCLVLVSAALAALAVDAPAVEKAPTCPPIIASLLPKQGSIRAGSYNASGPMGMGSGAADLPFEHPCIPNVKLTGVALTASVRLEVTVEGRISVDLAKAAVAEVFDNLKKADFSKAK